MQRRFLLSLAALTPAAWLTSCSLGPRSETSLPLDYREQAQQLNRLAANIHTLADARRLVDFLAEVFAEQIPSAFPASLRTRIAHAEFAAVSDPQKLIPELGVAEAWNSYIETIKARDASRVTRAELHNLRDAFLAMARMNWSRGVQSNIWAVPSIYATQTDGSLAPGCRPIEIFRVLWDLARFPENLALARDRVRRGILASDLFRPLQNRSSKGQVHLEVRASNNPVEIAAQQFVHDHGTIALNSAVVAMIDQTLA